MKLRLLLLFSFCLVAFARSAETLDLALRTRSKDGVVAEKQAAWDPAKTALIICDMWDTHTCPNSAARVGELGPRGDAFANALRAKGALMIHCPSAATKFYDGRRGRKLAQAAPVAEPKVPLLRWCYL